jgi:outer membrane usher protein
VHAEVQSDRQTLGVGTVLLVPWLGILNGAVAASHSRAGSGGLVSVGLERQANPVSFGAHLQLANERFTQLGLDPGTSAPRRLANLNLGVAVPGNGSVGVAYVYEDNRGSQPIQLVSASYSTQLGRSGYVSVGVSTALHQSGGTTVGVNWTIPLGQRTTNSVNVTRQQGRTEVLTQIQQGLPAGDGFGYLAQLGQQGKRDLSVSAQNSVGTYLVETATDQGQTGVRLNVAGGVALLGGVHLSRRITDSFALVKVPDFPNVRLYADNQLVGRTDASGEALLPRLRAYEKNPISIEQMDLPFDAKVKTLSIDAVPYYRSGMILAFPVTHARDALLTVTLDDGAHLPAGAEVTVAGQSETFPVGLNGQVYLTGLSAQNQLHATWRGQACDMTVPFSSQTDPLPDLGTFVCKGVRP